MKTLKNKKRRIDDSKEKLLAEKRRQFDQAYKNLEAGEDKLYEWLSLVGSIICKRCEGNEFTRCDGTRNIICLKCHSRQSFTSKTFFHKMKRATTLEYLFLLTLLDEGIEVSASEFERHSSVAYSTSLNMLKKCAIVIDKKMQEAGTRLAHCILFEEIVFRRSKETPAREHPRSEQKPVSAEQTSQTVSVTKTFASVAKKQLRTVTVPVNMAKKVDSLSDVELEILSLLENGPMLLDHLHYEFGNRLSFRDFTSKLSSLAIKDFVADNGLYVVRTKKSMASPKIVGANLNPRLKESLIFFIRNSYQGISQKASQLYFALHWFYMNRTAWRKGKVFDTFMRSSPVTDKEVLNYVSDQVLRISKTYNKCSA